MVSGLVWWGREQNTPLPSEPGIGPIRPPSNEAGPKDRSTPPAAPAAAAFLAEESDLDPPAPVPALPRNFLVRPGDDLLSVLAAAPLRSIITLTEDGPYLLGGRTGGLRGLRALASRDLTIKADSGVHPVLRFAADAQPGDLRLPALLPFSGGNVTIEGLAFELDREGPEAQVAAISAEDTELTIRGCLFRQSSLRTGRNRAALRIRAQNTAFASGDRPPAVFADSCHFDGGQVGIVAEGPADILLRDCTMGPGSPSIWIDDSKAAGPVPVDIHVWHSSLMAGAGPVFEVEGALARILVEDCVIAPAGNALATLVAIDSPRNLTWRGRTNLYGRMHTYLEPMQKGEAAETIDDFGHWRNTPSEVREVDTALANTSVWRSPQPLQDLLIEQDDPTQHFQVAAEFLKSSFFGARQGPYNASLADPVRLAGRLGESAAGTAKSGPEHASGPIPSSATAGAAAQTAVPRKTGDSPPAASNPGAAGDGRMPRSSTAADVEADSTDLPTMLPMSMPPTPDTAHPPASAAGLEPGAARPPARERPALAPGNRVNEGPGSTTVQAQHKGSQEDLIHSAEQLTNALNRLGSKGGTLKIARDVDLELPVTEFAASAQWSIEAEAGSRRPRIRFRPSAFPAKSTTAWSVLFNLRSGSLHLQGLDLLIPDQDPEAPRGDRQAAIGVSAGSELTLNGCTVTVAGRTSTSAAVVVQPGTADETSSGGARTIKNALIKIRDCFVRTAGDCISVASGRLLDLQLQNVLIGANGSLLHALGSAQIERSRTALKVKIDHALARTRGGLVYLESTLEETELPLTEIDAENSIFSTASTAGQAPLFRVDGQGQMERLHDRIVWRAEKVAYDEITTYRRDQILQTGVSPRDYTRSDWTTSFDPKDESPITESVKFRKKLELWRSASSLTKDDLQLDPNGPAAGRGPDPGKIPSPPPADS